MLIVAYSFRTLKIQEWCFLVALCRLIVRRPNLEVPIKSLLHQQVKIPGKFHAEVPGCNLLQQVSPQLGSKKYFKDWYLIKSQPTNLFLTQWFMAILSKWCKPNNFEPHNSLKLSFTNIWDLISNFVECESFLEENSPDILVQCETNLDDTTDSSCFSVRDYLPLIWKDSITHMHSSTVYVKKRLPFAWELSVENSVDSYLCFWLSLAHSVSYFFLPGLITFFNIMHNFWFLFI